MIIKTFDNLFNELVSDLDDYSVSNTLETTDNGYNFHVDLPGVFKEDISTEIDNRSLKIMAERKGFKPWKLNKRFRLPLNINTDNIEANYNNGVLTIFLPKSKENTKAIEIK